MPDQDQPEGELHTQLMQLQYQFHDPRSELQQHLQAKYGEMEKAADAGLIDPVGFKQEVAAETLQWLANKHFNGKLPSSLDLTAEQHAENLQSAKSILANPETAKMFDGKSVEEVADHFHKMRLEEAKASPDYAENTKGMEPAAADQVAEKLAHPHAKIISELENKMKLAEPVTRQREAADEADRATFLQKLESMPSIQRAFGAQLKKSRATPPKGLKSPPVQE